MCEMSIDDKAYLCLATSTGMRGAKNQKIFQTCDEIKARKLPKYDSSKYGECDTSHTQVYDQTVAKC